MRHSIKGARVLRDSAGIVDWTYWEAQFCLEPSQEGFRPASQLVHARVTNSRPQGSWGEPNDEAGVRSHDGDLTERAYETLGAIV